MGHRLAIVVIALLSGSLAAQTTDSRLAPVDDLTAAGGPGWADLGQGLAGTLGVPQLVGTGTLVVGDPVQLELTNVAQQLPSFLVYSCFDWQAPFKGGVMVPQPDFVIPFDTFGGAIVLGSLWPPGAAPGFTLYFQWWLVDPGGIFGWAASNTVSATQP